MPVLILWVNAVYYRHYIFFPPQGTADFNIYDRCPVSYIRRCIREETVEEWNARYKTEVTASVTKLFFPDAIKASRIIKNIDIDGLTTQLFTGHGGFSSYLNRFKCKDSPSCLCEPDAEETVQHLILTCPIYARRRYDLEQQIGTQIKVENLPEIINSKQRDTFISYCKYIIKAVNKRNKTV